MPHFDAPYYCSEQIEIPPELPDILKQFTKAAIRTQPVDLLEWSAKYFRCMTRGEVPPVKERLDMVVATQKVDSGLTLGIIKTLHKQLSSKKSMDLSIIEEKWFALSLPKERFDDIVRLGNFHGESEWIKFMALACSQISKNITETMTKVCEVLTADPPGANPRIPFDKFKDIYIYLVANIEKETPKKHVEDVCHYLEREWAKRQDGMIHPRNFQHPECPKLSFMT